MARDDPALVEDLLLLFAEDFDVGIDAGVDKMGRRQRRLFLPRICIARHSRLLLDLYDLEAPVFNRGWFFQAIQHKPYHDALEPVNSLNRQASLAKACRFRQSGRARPMFPEETCRRFLSKHSRSRALHRPGVQRLHRRWPASASAPRCIREIAVARSSMEATAAAHPPASAPLGSRSGTKFAFPPCLRLRTFPEESQHKQCRAALPNGEPR